MVSASYTGAGASISIGPISVAVANDGSYTATASGRFVSYETKGGAFGEVTSRRVRIGDENAYAEVEVNTDANGVDTVTTRIHIPGVGDYEDTITPQEGGDAIADHWIGRAFNFNGGVDTVADAAHQRRAKEDAYSRGVAPDTGRYTRRAQVAEAKDPLTFDLNGNGIETVGISATSPILFDHNADGIKTNTGWVKPSDGFLAFDRNGNGTIDSGRELFGDSTLLYGGNGATAASGFEALAQDDSNLDGKIDSADANWSQLRMWRDLNQDGVSQSGELLTLEQAGVASISLTRDQNGQMLADGNWMGSIGSYTRTDGQDGVVGEVAQVADLSLAEDTFTSEFTDHIPLLEDADLLPGMFGSGQVREMREAASITNADGTAFKAKLEAYSNATTRAEQRALLDELVIAWGETSAMQTSIDLSTAETNPSWIRHSFMGNHSDSFTPATQSSTTVVEDFAAANPELYKKMKALEQFNGGPLFNSWVRFRLQQNGYDMWIQLSEQQQGFIDLAWEALRESVYQNLVLQTRFQPVMNEIMFHFGNDGTMTVDFSAATTHFEALVAADAATGMSDLIEFNRASRYALSNTNWVGFDLVANYVHTLAATPELLAVYAELGVIVAGQEGALIKGTSANETYIAANGNDIFSAAGGDDILVGGQGNNNLSGDDGNDHLFGKDGADTLFGGNGRDVLEGGDGNDILSGGADMDVLTGGAGNDVLNGGAGNNTYLFGKGDGQDRIDPYYGGNEGQLSVLRFKQGVLASEVLVTRSGNDLVLTIAGSTDKVTVDMYFSGDDANNTYNPVQEIQFADNTFWDYATVMAMAIAGTDAAQSLTGYAGADTINALGGNDWVAGQGGNDTLDGGAGVDSMLGGFGDDSMYGGADNDIVQGESGDDRLDGGTGNDALHGGGGNDTYLFGRGDGQDTIGADYESSAGKFNVLEFKAGVLASEVLMTRSGNDLVLSIAGSTDTVTASQYFNGDTGFNTSNPLQQIKFSDGTSWDIATIMATTLTGTDAAQTLHGYADADTINALAGNDWVSGQGGNDMIDGGAGADSLLGGFGEDTLFGGADNDVLLGESGDDRLDGGAGNDALHGGSGNDTYLFGKGDGQDTIGMDAEVIAGKLNVLEFKADVLASEVLMTRSGNDLVLSIAGTTDKVTVNQYFYGNNAVNDFNPLQQIKFADGTVFTAQMVQLVTSGGTEGADTLTGTDNADVLGGLGGNDWLRGQAGNDILDGGAGVDSMLGGSGEDTMFGGAGNDIVQGESGNDRLDGGAGNDALHGGAGNDTYLFGKGDGQDTIGADYETIAGKLNVLEFKAGVLASEVRVTRSGNDLVLSIAGTTDTVTASQYFNGDTGFNTPNPLQQIKFSDGTSWDIATIMTMALTGTDAAQTLHGYAGADTINALAGNDWVAGQGGNDILDGGAGVDSMLGGFGEDIMFGGADSDIVQGESGNDRLDGGAGNDALHGGAGNDTYLFGKGDGQDTIGADYETIAGKLNVLEFKAGVLASEVVVTRSGNDLVLSIAGTTDKVTASTYFSGDTGNNTSNPLQQIKFSDGTSWDVATVMAMAITGTNTAQTLQGYLGADTINALAGNDWVAGQGGNDILDGGAGADTVLGGVGDDTLLGGADNDTVQGESGNDRLDGGAGNDALHGGANNDTYLFGKGDGQDTIGSDYDTSAGKLNVLEFKADVLTSEVVATRSGNDLVLTIAGTANKVTASMFFYTDNVANAYNPLQQVKFNDGTVWDAATLKAKTMAPAGASTPTSSPATTQSFSSTGTGSTSSSTSGWYDGHVAPMHAGNLIDGQVDALISAMASFAPPSAALSTGFNNPLATVNPIIVADFR